MSKVLPPVPKQTTQPLGEGRAVEGSRAIVAGIPKDAATTVSIGGEAFQTIGQACSTRVATD